MYCELTMRVGWCAVKAGPFHEHSNQLWNISGVPNWPKVYSGKILFHIDKTHKSRYIFAVNKIFLPK
jgi:hypothetical protein